MTLATKAASSTKWTFLQDENLIRFGPHIIEICSFVKIPDQPWFQGKSVAVALDYKKPRDAINNNVDQEDKSTLRGLLKEYGAFVNRGQRGWPLAISGKDGESPTENQLNSIYINEPGFYSLISSSKQAAAKAFSKWVRTDVLPSLRKHGSYTLSQPSVAPVTVSVDPPKMIRPAQLIMSMLNPSDVDFVRERDIKLRPLIEHQGKYQTTYMAIVRLLNYDGLFVKYGSTDQLYVRQPTHLRNFVECIMFSVFGTIYNSQAETAFGAALVSRQIKYERTFTHEGKTYNELIPYNESTNLLLLENLMTSCIEQTKNQMDATRYHQSLLVKEITGIDTDPQNSDLFQLHNKIDSLCDDIRQDQEYLHNKIDALCNSFRQDQDILRGLLSQVLQSSRGNTSTNSLDSESTVTSFARVVASEAVPVVQSNTPVACTSDGQQGNTSPPNREVQQEGEENVFAEYSRAKKKKKEPETFLPQPRQRSEPQIPKNPLSAEKQWSVDHFIDTMCELGVDEMPHKWHRTQQYFEPRTCLHWVYQRFIKTNPVNYSEFVVGLLTRGVVEESRTYPSKRSTPKGPCHHPRKSFVGIRLKSRPSDDLAKDVDIFLGQHVQIIDREEDIPEIPISTFFRAFDSKFPGWTAYYVNQHMLQLYHRLGKHHHKGEKAWINLKLVNIDQADFEDLDVVDDEAPN